MPFLTDTFTDTNGTNLQSHTGDTPHTWTKISGTNNAVIQSNALQGDGGASGTCLYRASIAAATPDYQVSASITTNTGTAQGICGRMNSAGSDFYLARYLESSTRWELFSFVSGSGTSIGTWTEVRSAGQTSTCVLDMRGTTIRVLIDGTERISVTSSTVTAAGYAGVRLNELATGIMDSLSATYMLVGLTELSISDSNFVAGFTRKNVVIASSYIGFHHTPSGFNISFTGTQLRVEFDVSHLSPLSADNYPMIMYSVDNGAFTEAKLTSSTRGFNLATGLSAGTHTVDFLIKKTASSGNVIGELAGPKIVAVGVSSGGAFAARTLPTDETDFFGDSITRGRGLDDTGVLGGDGIGAWPVAVAEALNSRHGIVGISGQGWTVGGTGGESDFEVTWPTIATGYSRQSGGLLSPMPTRIVICHGTNDSAASDGAVTTAVTNTLVAMRAAAPSIPIYVIIPFSQTKKTAIESGVVGAGGSLSSSTVYGGTVSRCTTDTNLWLIDLGTGASLGIAGPIGSATQQANDNLHPDQRTVGRLASRISGCIAWAEKSATSGATVFSGAGMTGVGVF